MPVKKSVSIQMVAEHSGVSIATVSRVMNNDPKVSEKTRTKVMESMKECGYVIPTPQNGNIKKVGIILDTTINNYYHALAVSINELMDKQGIRAIMANLNYKKESLPDVLKTIYDCNICGVILISCDYLSIKDIIDPRIPHVWIDCNDEASKTKEICQVQSDHYTVGVLAAQELYRKGCLNPIILTGSSSSHRMKDRFTGFRSVYENQGISLSEDCIIHTPRVRDMVDESKQTIRYLIGSGRKFDGVFAISDLRALGAFIAFQDLEVKIPDEMKIIGFDGVSATQSALNISSIRQDVDKISENACRLLISQMEHTHIENKRVIIPVSILNGQTL